jgi:hypothetical protein
MITKYNAEIVTKNGVNQNKLAAKLAPAIIMLIA